MSPRSRLAMRFLLKGFFALCRQHKQNLSGEGRGAEEGGRGWTHGKEREARSVLEDDLPIEPCHLMPNEV
jgi:hypothetical protein